ncbi:hypothetical protein N9H39_07075 [Gammaproteobacteria bacterium]|nr:hypothetical protein [Gammaproteobacteria bacterium]
MKLPALCEFCETYLSDIDAANGGLVYCSHGAGNTVVAGTFVAIVPPVGPGGVSKMHLFYPCTIDEAKAHRVSILAEISGAPNVTIQ